MVEWKFRKWKSALFQSRNCKSTVTIGVIEYCYIRVLWGQWILTRLVSCSSLGAFNQTVCLHRVEQPAHIGPAFTECYRAKTCAWKMSGVWPYRLLSLAPVQTKNTFINIHLPSPFVDDNSIHFGQSICSAYTHRLRWGTKGPLWLLAGENHRRMSGTLHTAFFRRPSASRRAPPLGSGWTGSIGAWKVKNTLIGCHMLVQRAPSVYIQVNESGQLLRKHCDRRRCEKVDEAHFLLSCPYETTR